MFTKLLVACVLAVACGLEYPPGVDPAECPDYPYCQHELVRVAVEPDLPVPEWVLNPAILPVAPIDPAHGQVDIPAFGYVHAPAPGHVDVPTDDLLLRYPADFDPALCPNYPYCFE